MQMFMEVSRRQHRTGCGAVPWWIVGRFCLWSILRRQLLHERQIVDAAWTIRERFEARGLPIWFMPYVNLQRPGQECRADSPFCGESGVIRPGDVLHTDVGVCYLKLCTDTQEMGYVLRAGEDAVPDELQSALAEGNRWQDLLTNEFVTGRTGNEILAAAQRAIQGNAWGFNVYTHPIGVFGHAPGPTVGMWDVPESGAPSSRRTIPVRLPSPS